MSTLADKIASTVLRAYNSLPPKSKPLPRGSSTEWIPLSGVTLEVDGELSCVVLGTGMKCLPKSKVALAGGMVLHDCHAEVLAIRGLNCFFTEECRRLSTDASYTSKFIRRRSREEIATPSAPQPFTVREGVRIHFYSSETPCGDASMELTISTQQDQTPWPTPPLSESPTPPPPHLRGRTYFSHLGQVRTKPGRSDSPPTHSKSCTDKLSLRQVVSTLLSPASILLSPQNAYISTLTLPHPEYSAVSCARAFGPDGRMARLKGREWRGWYRFSPFEVKTTGVEFEYSRRAVVRRTGGLAAVGSNISALWVTNKGLETLVGGVLQGRKQFGGVRGASMACKLVLWGVVRRVAAAEGVSGVAVDRYRMLKEGSGGGMEGRNEAKEEARGVLGGWVRNGGDDFGVVEG